MNEVSRFQVRNAVLSDSQSIAEIHKDSLPNDPATELGVRFMSRSLYPQLIREAKCALVSTDSLTGRVIGFVIFGRPVSMWSIMRRNPGQLFDLIRSGKILKPALWRKTLTVLLLGMRQPRDLPECELQWIALDRQWQGQGIGHRMLALGLDSLARNGTNSVWVRTLAATPENIRFYENAGFKERTRLMGRVILVRTVT